MQATTIEAASEGTAPTAVLPDGRRLLSRSRAAKLLGVSGPVLQRAIDRGDVPVTRLGYRLWIPSVVVERLLTGAPLATENGDACAVAHRAGV